MKKVYFIAIALAIVMAASCTSPPKSQDDSPAPETPGEVSPPPEGELPELAEEFPPEELNIEDFEIEDFEDDGIAGIDAEDADGEEGELEEADLAALPAEEESPAEVEPEPPAVTAVPEPPPPPAPPPPVAPRPATPPPAVTARPTPPQAAAPPPAVTAPAPPPSAEPPQEAPPAEPPAPTREPVPRVIPELPNPTPAFRGRPDDEVVFSRTVRATVGQLVVVPFRGTGWVYLGEVASQRGIAYDSRRLDPEGQSYIFRTEAAGEYALKFYRQDFTRDFILNDYVQVIVSDPPEAAGAGWFNPPAERGRVTAEPRWPTSLEEAQALRGNTQPSRPDVTAAPPPAAPAVPGRPPVQPPAQTPPASPPPAQPPRAQTPPAQTTPPPATLPPAEPAPPAPEPPVQIPELEPDEYLQKAKEEFEAGRVPSAISYLDRFHEFYPADSDEVLWLYGQFYEANSPSRNILTALEYYRRLTQEYPQSGRYDAARRRIAYLQRYYINIQ